jgi:hypothetical protein
VEPLIVTARLAAPIALTGPRDLSLDGLLASVTFGRLVTATGDVWPEVADDWRYLPLPLRLDGPDATALDHLTAGASIPTVAQAGLWWYACSAFAWVDPHGVITYHWTKRMALDSAHARYLTTGDKKAVIVTDKGRYRDYHMPLPTRTAVALQWRCVGDGAALCDLLGGLAFIGKKHAQGYGELLPDAAWDVAPDSADHSLWTPDGALARPVPAAALPSLNVAWHTMPQATYTAFRAPQWHTANQTQCLIGGRRR